MYIHILAIPSSLAQAHLASWVGSKISLGNLTVYAPLDLACQLNYILALLLYGLRQLQNRRYFLQHTVEFFIEVLVVVYYPQVRMPRPRLYDLLVEHPRYLQSLLVCFFQSLGVIACCIELLGTIGSRYKMQYCIIALVP